MKYLSFWEQEDIDPEERARISRRAREERYGRVVLPPYFYATFKGVTVVEIGDPRQLANRMALVAPYMRIRAVPLIRSTMFSEAVDKVDKQI